MRDRPALRRLSLACRSCWRAAQRWPPSACDGPGLSAVRRLRLQQVAAAVNKDKRLKIAVVGTGSSTLAGPDGPSSAYPARLEAALEQPLAGCVKVVTLVRAAA